MKLLETTFSRGVIHNGVWYGVLVSISSSKEMYMGLIQINYSVCVHSNAGTCQEMQLSSSLRCFL